MNANTSLSRLIEIAKEVRPTAADREKQRRSFVYGNTAFENRRISREMVERQADELAQSQSKSKVG
jgi:hypothetical protein